MEVTPRLPDWHGRARKKSAQASAAVRFGGVGDGIAAFIGLMDRNKVAELALSDGVSMVGPRTAIAGYMRGGDDARETFLREMSGLIGNVFLAGLSSRAMMWLMGNRLNFYNPHGIPTHAWINARNLGGFQTLYENALHRADTPAQARENLVHAFLSGLESGDREFSLESRLQSARGATENLTHQKAMVQALLETVYGPAQASQALPSALAKVQSGQASSLQALKNQLRRDGWGRLSGEGRTALAQHFALPAPAASLPEKGCVPFDLLTDARLAARAREKRQRVGEQRFQEEEALLRKNPRTLAQTRLQARLDLSLTHLYKNAAEARQQVDQAALSHGLTGTVHLKNGETLLSAGQNRATLLMEMKHFLEQYVDRAHHALGPHPPPGAGWKFLARQTLFGKPENPNLWQKLAPQLEDGLVTATLKSKAAYTAVPLVFTSLALAAFAFYNNWLTMKKNGGKVFFPGEGLPSDANPLTRPFSLPYRNFNAFPHQAQQPPVQGGIIA